VSGYQKLQIMT